MTQPIFTKKHYEQYIIFVTFTCLWLILELAGDFGKEFEGETSSCLPVTYATFAVACLAALNSVGSIQAVCKERKYYFRAVCFDSQNKEWGERLVYLTGPGMGP